MRYESVNRILLPVIRRGKIYKVRKGFRKLTAPAKSKYHPIDPEIEERHRALWEQLYKPVDPIFLRFYSNFSEVRDHRFVPQDLFMAIVERILNDIDSADYYADKNHLDRMLGPDHVPEVVLRRMRDSYMDRDYRITGISEAKELLSGIHEDIIVKPAVYSGGGKKIEKWFYRQGTYHNAFGQKVDFDHLLRTQTHDFIVQKIIHQHPFLKGLNECSVNTFRCVTYRSVKDERVHVTSVALSVGKPGRFLIHGRHGGMIINVNQDGSLGPFAYTNDMRRYREFPGREKPFAEYVFPYYDKMIAAVCEKSLQFPKHRTIAFDVTLNEEARPIFIEVNLHTAGISNQMITGPMYRDFLEEIIDYCASHRYLDNFRAFRT